MQQLLSKHRLPVTILLAVLIQLSLPMAVYAFWNEQNASRVVSSSNLLPTSCSGTRCNVTTITCQPNPATQSKTATCTATVADTRIAAVTPTGKVTQRP